jgi:hypothetical protein
MTMPFFFQEAQCLNHFISSRYCDSIVIFNSSYNAFILFPTIYLFIFSLLVHLFLEFLYYSIVIITITYYHLYHYFVLCYFKPELSFSYF